MAQGLQKVKTCGLWGASRLPPAEASSGREKLLLLRRLLEQWTSRRNTSWTSRRYTSRTSIRNTCWTYHRNTFRTYSMYYVSYYVSCMYHCRNKSCKSCQYIPPPDSVDKFSARESWYRAQYRAFDIQNLLGQWLYTIMVDSGAQMKADFRPPLPDL